MLNKPEPTMHPMVRFLCGVGGVLLDFFSSSWDDIGGGDDGWTVLVL